MPSTNKTTTIGLNQWEETDRPQRADFNNDNQLVEEYIVSHTEDEDIHLTSIEKSRVSSPVINILYFGDGSAERTVTLPAVAWAVSIIADKKPSAIYDSTEKCTKVYNGSAHYGTANTGGVLLKGGTVVVENSDTAIDGVRYCLNEEGVQYSIVIVR